MVPALLAAVLGGGAAAAQSTDPVYYTVGPVMEGRELIALAVEIRFAGEADGETLLRLPGEWAGTDSLWQQVEGLRVDGATAVRGDAGTRVISHRPGAPLAVRYRVRSGYDADPGFQYHKALPIILPGWFFFHGEGVFALPDGRQSSPARFAWRGVPAGWKVASDLDHMAAGHPGTAGDVVQSAAIGAPDLAVVQRDVGGAPLRIAMRGAWDFTADALANAVTPIVQAHNAFWGDAGRPFLVPLVPLGGSGASLSYTGTHRGDAFSIASTPGFPLAQASRFLAHEYMHTWIAAEVGGPPEGEGAPAFWITEGFTDFYAGRTLLRAGLWTPADFVAELNGVLARYAASPARTVPNAGIAERFWTDGDVQQLPYDRGHLLALLLDHRIRLTTGGRVDMDDAMVAQREQARRNAQAGTRVDAASLFPTVMRQALGIGVGEELASYVERGEMVLLPADLFGTCAEVRTMTQPEFHRGFDLPATEANGRVITGTDPASLAYAAGLRDGMRILAREAGVPGDATVEYAYRVDDAGTERVIRYLPQGKGRITIQRVLLGPDGSSERCRRLMGGA
jgi:predicted metalloprotease with PDZ domain